MALPSRALGVAGCCNCRRLLLRSFMTVAADQRISSPETTTSRRQRHFSQIARPRKETSTVNREIESISLNEINDALSPEDESVPQKLRQDIPKQTGDVPYIPWYLQSQCQPEQAPSESSLSARQRLPDLPVHPPPILQPLLDRVSVDLGMDDLALLDLRALDPPPALGANLLMIVGTARSERHLHVSADRLCRWLRSENGLSPFADGLLGRNELKLKLRRRAKRNKLLSAAGGANNAAGGEGGLDDGIRTGWVCVNVGRVEGGEVPQEHGRADGGIVGFGATAEGCNVVVQLLTAEKRGEIGLETLWGGILNRAIRDGAAMEEGNGEARGDPVVDNPAAEGSGETRLYDT